MTVKKYKDIIVFLIVQIYYILSLKVSYNIGFYWINDGILRRIIPLSIILVSGYINFIWLRRYLRRVNSKLSGFLWW